MSSLTAKQKIIEKIRAKVEADSSLSATALCEQEGISFGYYHQYVRNNPTKKTRKKREPSAVVTYSPDALPTLEPVRSAPSIVPPGYAAIVLMPADQLRTFLGGAR